MNVSVTTDMVVLLYDRSQKLNVLLIERRFPPHQGSWALPGGFLDDTDISLEAGALRELQEETAIILPRERIFSCGSYGDINRDPRSRTVTAAYCALITTEEAQAAQAGDDAGKLAFFPIDSLSTMNLAFDHRLIIDNALTETKLRLQAEGKISKRILPPELGNLGIQINDLLPFN